MKAARRVPRLAATLLLPMLAVCGGDDGPDGGGGEPRIERLSHIDLAGLMRAPGSSASAAGASGSGNWGYTSPTGRRLALTGTSEGLSIVEVTDPSLPRILALIPGARSIWREVRTYRHYAYVTTEARSGLDIIDLSDPDHPRKVRTWNRTFSTAHTLWIDEERGLLFANGTRDAQGLFSGMRVLDLNANPEDPTDLGAWLEYYVHDSYTHGTTLYAAAISDGWVGVLDTSDPRNLREVTRFETGGHFTHNAWLTRDGRYLFTTDEVPGRPVEGWDLADVHNPRKVSGYIAGPDTLPHNVLIDGDRLLVAHYGEGVHLVDISDPSRPRRMASYDTQPDPSCPGFGSQSPGPRPFHPEDPVHGNSPYFCGAWSAYLFPGTDLILVGDINGGLFVLGYRED